MLAPMTTAPGGRRPIRTLGIAIATHRRPELLRALLDSIAAQRFTGDEPAITLAITDNSPDLEGLAVIEQIAPTFRWPIVSDHEPQPGIATTRNRTVRLLGSPDAIVFVDDDETAQPDWLDRLVHTAVHHDADVVSGPVLPNFSEPPPAWAVDGRFYERDRWPTGTITGTTATSNLLVRRVVFDLLGDPWFEPSLGLIGCDDTHFLERAQRAGHPSVWCDEAIVAETFPADRVRPGWLIQRSFRGGNSYAIVQRMLAPGRRTNTRLLAKGGVRAVGSVALLPFAVWRTVPRIKVLQSLAKSVGQLSAFFSVRYEEYRRARGSAR